MNKIILSYLRTVLFYAIICYFIILFSGLITHSIFGNGAEIFDVPVAMLISLAAALVVSLILSFSKYLSNMINDKISIVSTISDSPKSVILILSSSVFTSMLLATWVILATVSASFMGKVTYDLLGLGKSTAMHGLLGMLMVAVSGYYNWLYSAKRRLITGDTED